MLTPYVPFLEDVLRKLKRHTTCCKVKGEVKKEQRQVLHICMFISLNTDFTGTGMDICRAVERSQ